jgi:hypothetical protein
MATVRHARRTAARRASISVCIAVLASVLGPLASAWFAIPLRTVGGPVPQQWPLEMPAGAPERAGFMYSEWGPGIELHIHSAYDREMNVGWKVLRVEAGWPRRSWRAAAVVQTPHPPLINSLRDSNQRSRLPRQPIWGGLVINIMAYSGAVFLVWYAAARVIHTARNFRVRSRRPGRCGTCGYDLTGLPGPNCPECGGVFRVEGVPRPSS